MVVIKEIPQWSSHGLTFLLYILSVDFYRSDGKKIARLSTESKEYMKEAIQAARLQSAMASW